MRTYNPRTRRWEEEGAPVRSVPTPGDSEVLMPFGKHAGDCLSEIDAGYLRWVLRECDVSADLRRAIERELEER